MKGRKHGAELTPEQKANAYRLHRHKGWTIAALATRYSTSPQGMSNILRKMEKQYEEAK